MFILCPKCSFGIKVDGDPEEIENLLGERTDLYGHHQCPLCWALCEKAPFADNAVLGAKHMRTLTPYEAHLLFEGLGFPEERDCVAETVTDELLRKRIKAVKAKTVPNTTRAVVEQVVLEDDTTLFFSGSAQGALVYRIRKPHPYLSTFGEESA
jgi:hypothetical protein